MDEQQYNKMMSKKVARLLVLFIVTFIFIMLLLLYKSGYTVRRIGSDSMEPYLFKNDLCIIKKYTFDDAGIGDVICVHSDKGDVIHRVVVKTNKYGKTQLYTKGDNNIIDDKIPVNNENYIGKVISIIPLAVGANREE